MEFVLKRLIWFFLRSMMLTYRFSYREVQYLQSAKEKSPNGTFVFAMWHELVWPTMAAHAWREPYLALASRSKDGNYAAFIAEKVGFTSVRGSSRKGNKDKGGKEAMMIYINGLKNKMSAGMTVDGPKGPRQVCKPGIAIIAKETGSPILPTKASLSSYWEFKSWDRFKMPKPFCKIEITYGEPIFVPADTPPEKIEHYAAMVTAGLNLGSKHAISKT